MTTDGPPIAPSVGAAAVTRGASFDNRTRESLQLPEAPWMDWEGARQHQQHHPSLCQPQQPGMTAALQQGAWRVPGARLGAAAPLAIPPYEGQGPVAPGAGASEPSPNQPSPVSEKAKKQGPSVLFRCACF